MTSPPGRTLTAMAEYRDADFHVTSISTQDVAAVDAGLHVTGRLSLDLKLFTATPVSAGLTRYEDGIGFLH